MNDFQFLYGENLKRNAKPIKIGGVVYASKAEAKRKLRLGDSEMIRAVKLGITKDGLKVEMLTSSTP